MYDMVGCLLLGYSIATRESEDTGGGIFFSGSEHRRGPLWFIWSVGEFLGLQTDRRTLPVSLAPFPTDRTVKEIPGIHLDARLGSEHLQGYACLRRMQPGGADRRIPSGRQHPVMVVSLSISQLDVISGVWMPT